LVTNISRGPVKGYVEALEHRLEATEDALVKLLAAAHEDTVSSAFQDWNGPMRGALGFRSTGPANHEGNKARLIAHWEQFPLNTAEEVKIWAEEIVRCSRDGSGDSSRAYNVVPSDGGDE